jgi:hypothetical protein
MSAEVDLPGFSARSVADAAGWGQAFVLLKLVWGFAGGSTNLDNLILLCHRHHWMAHEGGWQLVRSNDGRMLAVPPATEFQRLARGPD